MSVILAAIRFYKYLVANYSLGPESKRIFLGLTLNYLIEYILTLISNNMNEGDYTNLAYNYQDDCVLPLNLSKEKNQQQIKEEINNLIDNLRNRKKSFKDRSRLFCCGFFSFGMVLFITIFYVFDVLKYEQTCKKSKKFMMEICDAPSLSFWTRFFIILISMVLLLFGLYCTGATLVIFDPANNKLIIDKKKLICLPSIYEYNMSELKGACLESDNYDSNHSFSNFQFTSVILLFDKESVNLGLGRDCFDMDHKSKLAKSMNRYLDAIKRIE